MLAEALDYHERSTEARSAYLPLSATSAGRYNGAVELLLRDAATARGYRSQFWVSGRALQRDFEGRLLPGEEHHGVDIGIGFGPVRVYNVSDVEASDLHFFFQQYPLPADDSTFGSHIIFVDGRWCRFKNPLLNSALDSLHSKHCERVAAARESLVRESVRGGSDAPSSGVVNVVDRAVSVTKQRAIRTSPERRLAVALERMAVAVPFAAGAGADIDATPTVHELKRNRGNFGTYPKLQRPHVADPVLAGQRYTAAAMLAHPPRRWILVQDVAKHRLTLAAGAEPYDAVSTGVKLFNACQTTVLDAIESMWRGRVPAELWWSPDGSPPPEPLPLAERRSIRNALHAGASAQRGAEQILAPGIRRPAQPEAAEEPALEGESAAEANIDASPSSAASHSSRVASLHEAQAAVEGGHDAMQAVLARYLSSNKASSAAS